MQDGQQGAGLGGGDVESFAPFQEEGALLGEEQTRAEVGIHLPRVRLDLGEIGVHGGVQDEAGREAVFPGEAPLPVVGLAHHDAILAGALSRQGKGREQLKDGGAGQPLVFQHRHLGQEGITTGGVQGGEGAVFLAPVDGALEEHRHLDHGPVQVADALQGDPDFHGVAFRIDAGGAVPDHVDTEVFLVAGEAAVPLDPEGRDVERVQGLLVVEGVQVDADEVAAGDVVTAGQSGLDLVGVVVEAAEGEVEVLLVVGHVGDGLLRLLLAEFGDERLEVGHGSRLSPHGIVQPTIQEGRRGGLEGFQDGFAGHARVEKRREEEQGRQEAGEHAGVPEKDRA